MIAEAVIIWASTYIAAHAAAAAIRAIRQGKAREREGEKGEKALAKTLKRLGRKLGAKQARDLLLWKDLGKTIGTQLDNVFITRQGVYCLEMKNYRGCVSGKAKAHDWTHVTPDGKYKKFYNPIWQNQGHKAAVRNALKKQFPGVPVYGVVVFGDGCALNIKGKTEPVLNMKDLPAYFAEQASRPEVLIDGDIGRIAQSLEAQNDVSKEGRQRHLAMTILKADEKSQARGGKPVVRREPAEHAVVPSKLEGDILIKNAAGEYQTIADMYRKSLRAFDNGAVRRNHPPYTFVCPFTGRSFPAECAEILYDGLVASYLRSNPRFARELVELRAKGRITTNNPRFDRALNRYAEDPAKFSERVYRSEWYRSVAASRARSLDSIINGALRRAGRAGQPVLKARPAVHMAGMER